MTIAQIDQFIAGLSEDEFREYLTAALDHQHTPPGARAVILAFKRPWDKKPLRALVYDVFGPRPAARQPIPDEIPDLDLP